jgi:hypothetical protein
VLQQRLERKARDPAGPSSGHPRSVDAAASASAAS